MDKRLFSGTGLFLLLFCISGFADQLQIGTVYTDQANEVSFVVTLPPGLDISPKSSDFQLLDGSKVIKKSADAIEPFIESNRKLILLFSVDVSGSINNATLKETQDALLDFFSVTLPNDKYQFGLVSFADKIISFPDFTDNKDTLQKHIHELNVARAQKPVNTLLYQSILESLNELEQLRPNEYRRILVFSDGKDEGNKGASFDDVVNLSKRLGIPIDGFAIGGDQPQFDGTGGLNGLATATGGRFIDSRDKSMNLKDAVIQSHNTLIENTWIVHFKYRRDNEKPALKNSQIKFNPNQMIDFNTVFSGFIPAPLDIPIENSPPQSSTNIEAESNGKNNWIQEIMEKLSQPSTYWILSILLLVTLIVIAWIVRRNQKNHSKNDSESKELIEPALGTPTPDIQLSEPSEKNERRKTAISPSPMLHHSTSDRPFVILEITEGSQAGQKISVTKSSFHIGSNPDNDLVLFDDYVSRNHASLTYENGNLILTDLNSRNGTLLNGVSINNKTSVVTPGDVIKIGNSTLKIIEM